MAEGRLARWRRRISEHGLGAALAKAFGDHVFRASESVMVETFPDRMRAGGNESIDPGLRFATIAAPTPLPPLCPFLAPRRAAFQAMLADGKQVLLALRDGVVVGTIWIATSDHRDRAAREHYRVAPGEGYCFCYLLDPAERARGTALAQMRAVSVALRDLGIRRAISVIDRANRASYMIQRHFNGREYGERVRHFYILGTRWTWRSRYDGVLGPLPARRKRHGTVAPA